MNTIREIEFDSTIYGPEPSGCVHCREGAKMVLLVTGLCKCGCYYCPISEKKMGRDHIYANELLVGVGKVFDDEIASGSNVPNGLCVSSESNDTRSVTFKNAIIEEARSISASGTGITGGDPLLVLDRTLGLIKILKEAFGRDHHIHLYTASLPAESQLQELKEAGLDEIRFHLVDLLEMYSSGDDLDPMKTNVLDEFFEGYLDAIEFARKMGMDTGVEIPMIPGHLDLIHWLIPKLEIAGAQFLNLNELEFSPTNAPKLLDRGFEVRDDLSSAVKGSREEAYELMQRVWALRDREKTLREDDGANRSSLSIPMTIHFCSSSYKDAGQLRRRLHRRAENIALPHEHITEDDTLLIGIVESTWNAQEFAEEIMDTYEIPGELVYVNPGPGSREGRVEVDPWVLQEIAGDLKAPAYLIEEYPTSDRLEVEREKLN